MYSVRPYQAYSFHCWCSNNSVSTLLLRIPFQALCGRSWHCLLQSFIPMIYLLFFIPEALCCCSLRPIFLFCQDHVIFVVIHLTRVLCNLFKFFSSYQVLHLFSTGVLSEFVLPCFLVYLLSTRVVPIPSCPLYSSFIALQPPRFT